MSRPRKQQAPPAVPDDEVKKFLQAFALRFDGYAYAASRGHDGLLAEWAGRFVATLQLADVEEENHATFFALQRFLGKWGGETLAEESREHLAYRFLFLHLYRAEIPPEFVPEWSVGGMRDLDLGRLELIAARVREQMITRTPRHVDPLGPGLV